MSDQDLQQWGQEDSEAERRNRKLTQDLKALKQKLEAVQTDLDIAETRVDVALGISGPINPAPIKPRKRRLHEAVAVMVASDWHVGELVDPDTVNGVNEYTPEIAGRRIQNFFESCKRLVEVSRAHVHVEQVVLALLGDLVTGYIHEELVETNPLTPMEEVLFLQEILVAGIDYLLTIPDLRKLILPCCHGNHGRTSKRVKFSASAKNNYEWLLYHVLKRHYADDKRVQFQIASGRQLYQEIFETVIRWHHGDDMRYGGGIGGLSIPGRKACDAWDQQRKADVTVVGHWHQLVDYGFLVINGSLIGFNAFAQSIKARHEQPRQAFFLVDKTYGKTLFAPVYVT